MTIGYVEEKLMKTTCRRTTQLGEVIAAVFDEAAEYSHDPREVSWLANRAIANIIRRPGGAQSARKQRHARQSEAT